MALLTQDVSQDLPTTGRTTVSGGRAAARARVVPLLGLVVLVAGIAASNPALVLIGLGASATAVLLRWLPIDLALPCAAVGLVLAATVSGIAAAFAGIDLLGMSWLLALLYVAFAGLALLLPARRRPKPAAFVGATWLGAVPAAAATAIGLLQAFSTPVARSWAFWGTDITNHMLVLKELQQAGALDYSLGAYPKGVHILAALVSVPDAPVESPRQLLAYDLRLTTSITWFALAVLLWTGAALAIRLGNVVGWPRSTSVTAAVLLGVGAFVMNDFFVFFMLLGAAPSLLAVVVMWLIPATAFAEDRLAARPVLIVLASCAAVMTLAQLWQVLAIVPAVALGAYATRHLDAVRSIRTLRVRRVDLALYALGAAMLGLAALPVVLIHDQGGAAMAAMPADVPPGPWVLLCAGVLSAGLLLRHIAVDAVRLLLGSALGVVVATAVLLHWAGRGVKLDQYYPMKSLWFLTLLLSPVVALAISRIGLAAAAPIWRAAGRASHSFVLRSTVVALALTAVLAGWLPWRIGAGLASAGTWQAASSDGHAFSQPNRSAQRYDIAVHYGSAHRRAAVVPYFVGESAMLDALGTRMVGSLLAFQTGQALVGGDHASACTAIDSVAGDRSAVVISKLPVERVRSNMERNGCAGRARVVRVPGGISDVPAGRV